jgi:hypothetical protein
LNIPVKNINIGFLLQVVAEIRMEANYLREPYAKPAQRGMIKIKRRE